MPHGPGALPESGRIGAKLVAFALSESRRGYDQLTGVKGWASPGPKVATFLNRFAPHVLPEGAGEPRLAVKQRFSNPMAYFWFARRSGPHRDISYGSRCRVEAGSATAGRFRGEATERPVKGRGGSSMMPQKRNPVSASVALATALHTPGLVATMLDAMVQEHERGLDGWQTEWDTLPDLVLASAGGGRPLPRRGACVHRTRTLSAGRDGACGSLRSPSKTGARFRHFVLQ